MPDRNSGPAEGAKGIVEDVKGRVKEAFGALTGNKPVEREGEAQQDKAASQREAAGREAQAEKARTEAQMHEARQRAQQQGH
jgi:uncharacterized protein YjbJ (UPF0337 family)